MTKQGYTSATMPTPTYEDLMEIGQEMAAGALLDQKVTPAKVIAALIKEHKARGQDA